MRPSRSSQFGSAARTEAGPKAMAPRTASHQYGRKHAGRVLIFVTVPRSVECGQRMQNHTIPHAGPAPLTLIDIGINLTHDSYDVDRDAVIARARHVGVTQMIVTGASVEGSIKAVELARSRPGELFATAGVHPHHATELTSESLSTLEELARAPEVVAAGECGLDYFR